MDQYVADAIGGDTPLHSIEIARDLEIHRTVSTVVEAQSVRA